MRYYFSILVGLMAMCCLNDAPAYAGGTDTITLNRGWTLTETSAGVPLAATVPGVVQMDLIRHGKLPDPYYRLAEDSIQWVGERDWVYRTSFVLTEAQLLRPNIHLLFEGLDTYATVKLNGKVILQSKNMFVGHEVDVKGLVRGENELEITFASPLRSALPLYEASGRINYPADNDHAETRLSVFTRKAPYHYGWDWGERMLTLGPWRPVRLLLRGESYLKDYPVINFNPKAKQPIEVWLPEGTVVGRGEGALRYRLKDVTGKTVYEYTGNLPRGTRGNSPYVCHALPDPQLWWPNGMGKPYLYTAEFLLYDSKRAKKPCDSLSFRVGLRTIELVREADRWGRSFYFKVNGQPLYAKGANYIPPTLMLPARTQAELSQLFDDVVGSNFNMLRVWGGGVYEEDCFYDLADERGILVWQDFMFACTAYPGDEAFLTDVRGELDYNIRRLRRHASLATWCGNNEIREAMKYWGWQKKYSKETYQLFAQSYTKLFRQLIPSRLKALDPLRPYIESSPDTANWGRPSSLGLGESHYWGVWYGREPFEILRERIPRFMSEFGVQSFPTMPSVQRFSRPEDWAIESEVMKAHQKSSIGNDVILHYIKAEYPEPKRFSDFTYLSQVMQGRGIALGLRLQRAAAPQCMGSLYWQINDAWPAVSWSSIDYYGTWKGLQYQAKKAFQPVVLVPNKGGDTIRITSDRMEGEELVRLEAEVLDFHGNKLREWHSGAVRLSRGIMQEDIAVPYETFFPDEEAKATRFVRYRLTVLGEQHTVLSEVLYFAKSPKELRLPVPNSFFYSLEPSEDGRSYDLRLRSPILRKDLYIECSIPGVHLSDNFFDLLAGEEVCLRLTPRAGYTLPKGLRPESFSFLSINDLQTR